MRSGELALGYAFILIVGGIVWIFNEPHRFYWGVLAISIGLLLVYLRLRFGRVDAA